MEVEKQHQTRPQQSIGFILFSILPSLKLFRFPLGFPLHLLDLVTSCREVSGLFHQPPVVFVMLGALAFASPLTMPDLSLQPPTDGISSMAWSPDSNRLIVGSWDGVSGRGPCTGLHTGILTASLHAMNPADVAEHVPLPHGHPAATPGPVRDLLAYPSRCSPSCTRRPVGGLQLTTLRTRRLSHPAAVLAVTFGSNPTIAFSGGLDKRVRE